MKKISIIFAFLGLIFLLSLNGSPSESNSQATLELPSIIGDRMVLQQQTDVNLWGWDKPGNTVTVKFRGQEVQTPVEVDGKWQVKIPSGEAGGRLI
jgi:sialate O-acetylesterase